MTAKDAAEKRVNLKKLMEDLDKFVSVLNQDSETLKRLSASVGVIDIAQRVEYASRMLDNYDSCLAHAMAETQLKEVYV